MPTLLFRPEELEHEDSNAAVEAGQQSLRTVDSLKRSNLVSHRMQKRSQQKRFRTGQARKKKHAGLKERLRDSIKRSAKKQRSLPLLALSAILLVMLSMVSSCAPMVQMIVNANVIGTYPAEEADILAAEEAYANREKELQKEIDQYRRRHPGYDEYHIDADEIKHDPHALISMISAQMDGKEWTVEDAYPLIDMYFDLQYELDVRVSRSTRYNSQGEPYEYRICYVTLTNKVLSHQPIYAMSRKQVGMYALYIATHGNMPDLFWNNPHASILEEPMEYDVPQEYRDTDPLFERLIEEADQYVGYPYVWGGDSPETSFDCSGFLSYIYTVTGVRNTGRLGAKALYDLCEPVEPEDAKPGDMVFFQGTMGDVAGVTHCGMYVGDGMMIHCGNPIGYADLTDYYWQTHFYRFGRAY